jgi:hypothetical protein
LLAVVVAPHDKHRSTRAAGSGGRECHGLLPSPKKLTAKTLRRQIVRLGAENAENAENP